jgi:acyl phosphate:glycerol-3-phosphate acyltransferase
MQLIIFYKILLVIGSYLLGAVPVGYLIYKLKSGGDIRNEGSGNVGGTNVTRSAGAFAGVITVVLDIIKGFIPVLVLYYLFPKDLILLAFVGVAAVLGHDFPVYLKFKGGKGISTSFGVIIGLCSFPFNGISLWLQILPIFIIFFIWVIVFLASRIVSLGSLIAAGLSGPAFYFTKHTLHAIIIGIFIFILTAIAHRDNIKRLIRKEEKKLKRKGS